MCHGVTGQVRGVTTHQFKELSPLGVDPYGLSHVKILANDRDACGAQCPQTESVPDDDDNSIRIK